MIPVFLSPLALVGVGTALLLPGLWDTRSAAQYLPGTYQPYQGLRLARFFSPSVLYWGNQIEDWADQVSLDPNLVATLMQIGSCGDPLAHSRSGACGLFLVQPVSFHSGEDGFHPDTNARRCLEQLREVLIASGSCPYPCLAAYWGGTALLRQPEETWPAGIKRTAAWGAGIYRDAANGLSSSRSLLEWLLSGGNRLCWQAERRLGLH